MENLDTTHRGLLKLAETFDAICRANDIHYTLHGGSLLGAVREHGFIPWDDDLDIAMTRADFNKLKEVIKDNREYYVFGDIKKQFREQGKDTLWIDIFICDYISSTGKGKLKLALLAALDIMNRDEKSIMLSNYTKYSWSKQQFFKVFYGIGKIVPKKTKVNLYNKVAIGFGGKDRELIHRSNDTYKGRQEPFPAAWMEEYIRLPFENLELPVIKRYHDILLMCYGNDYMTPVKDTRNAFVHNIIRNADQKVSL